VLTVTLLGILIRVWF